MKIHLELFLTKPLDGEPRLTSCRAEVETEDRTFEAFKDSTGEALESLRDQIASEAQDLYQILALVTHLQHHLTPCTMTSYKREEEPV